MLHPLLLKLDCKFKSIVRVHEVNLDIIGYTISRATIHNKYNDIMRTPKNRNWNIFEFDFFTHAKYIHFDTKLNTLITWRTKPKSVYVISKFPVHSLPINHQCVCMYMTVQRNVKHLVRMHFTSNNITMLDVLVCRPGPCYLLLHCFCELRSICVG